jgi:hypothetical protein
VVVGVKEKVNKVPVFFDREGVLKKEEKRTGSQPKQNEYPVT